MVIHCDGSLWATGANGYGQLGDGSTTAKRKFMKVALSLDGALCTCLSLCISARLSACLYDGHVLFQPLTITTPPDSYLCEYADRNEQAWDC